MSQKTASAFSRHLAEKLYQKKPKELAKTLVDAGGDIRYLRHLTHEPEIAEALGYHDAIIKARRSLAQESAGKVLKMPRHAPFQKAAELGFWQGFEKRAATLLMPKDQTSQEYQNNVKNRLRSREIMKSAPLSGALGALAGHLADQKLNKKYLLPIGAAAGSLAGSVHGWRKGTKKFNDAKYVAAPNVRSSDHAQAILHHVGYSPKDQI